MVPQYSDWTLADLASHTASIHARTVLICRDQPTERISAPRLPEGKDPIDWCEETLMEMLGALSAADPATPSWAFGPNQVLGFWETRMMIETEVHRWDAEQAFDEPESIHPRVSESGLDEFDHLWLKQLGDVETLEVIATDLGRSWVYGLGTPTTAVNGEASDLYLRLISRPSAVALPAEWAEAVDALDPPPKR
jgi:uncharacterized protein (TIGR03083 family)